VRGIAIERHSRLPTEVAPVLENNPRLAEHFQHAGSDGRIKTIELNIFDSGVGLAARWLKQKPTDSLSLDDEHKACIECLTYRHTTASSPGRGIGLFCVLSAVAELRGLLRIRTGRLALYRDFANYTQDSIIDPTRPMLNDWTTGDQTLTAMSRVEGTLFTMLIPIQQPQSRKV